MTGLVQVVVLLVDRVGPAAESDGIAAAALASVRAYQSSLGDPAWELWLAGPFTKSVRRADAKTYAKIRAAHPEAVEAIVGDPEVSTARALGFPPLPMDSLPRDLSRLQVSGTKLPKGGETPERAHEVVVVLNRQLDMSTGKAAAQAAHALFSWMLASPPEDVRTWVDAGLSVDVSWAGEAAVEMAAELEGSGPLIQDAGRTEIAPGSVTAVALFAS